MGEVVIWLEEGDGLLQVVPLLDIAVSLDCGMILSKKCEYRAADESSYPVRNSHGSFRSSAILVDLLSAVHSRPPESIRLAKLDRSVTMGDFSNKMILNP